MRLRLLVVLGLVALAGCSGFVEDGSETPTLSPAPVPTPPPAQGEAVETGPSSGSLEAGIATGGVTDPTSIARRHVAAINDTSYVWTERYIETRQEANHSVHTRSVQRVTVENETTSYHRTRTNQSGDRYLQAAPYDHLLEGRVEYREGYEAYANGTVAFATWYDFRGEDRLFERRDDPTDREAFDTLARGPIERYLAANASTVLIIDGRGDWYEVTSSEPAVGLEPPAEDYSARAIVRADGFVRSLTVSYDRTVGDQTISVLYSFRYEDVGEASVTQPDWVDEANTTVDGES